MSQPSLLLPQGSEEDLPAMLARLWEQGQQPDLAEFLSAMGPLSLGGLADVVLVDQQERWRAGQTVLAEHYLNGFPELAQNPEEALLVVYREVLLRCHRGETPRLEDFQQRFPALAHLLPLQWEVHEALPRTGPRPSQTTGVEIEEESSPISLSGYQILGELGRGGMGVVWLARDVRLGRDVAVKVMKRQLADRADFVRRFLEEAQVSSQLQHPAIPPVHALGELPDGRPYIAMKVIRGRTLAELLRGRKSPSEDLGRFLGVFDQVCQALAYAHSRGVIHRDLKPANVMVGAFGEVQVMDWGLAKVLPGSSEGASAATGTGPPILTVRTQQSDSERVLTGVVGTLAYMPPEQARGQGEAVDERADVFGLGGILSGILTGQSPYEGGQGDPYERALRGDVAATFQRLSQCAADPELTALCQDCLAPRPEDRPQHAGEVATRLGAYHAAVQERLRTAEMQRVAAEARAKEVQATLEAEGRARRRAAWLAATLLLLVATGVSGAWWVHERRKATEASVTGLMSDARRLFEQARSGISPWSEVPRLHSQAQEVARQADELAQRGGVSSSLSAEATALARAYALEADRIDRERRLLAALLEVRGPRAEPIFTQSGNVLGSLAEPSLEEQFIQAFKVWDPTFDVDHKTTKELAERWKGRPAAVVSQVIAGLDAWAADRRRRARPETPWEPVAALAGALDEEDSKRVEIRALLARGNLHRERIQNAIFAILRPLPVPMMLHGGEDQARLRRLAQTTDVLHEPVLGLLSLERALRVAGEDQLAERLLRDALQARPGEVILYDALGKLLQDQSPPRWREAAECFAVTRALRPELGESLAFALVESQQAEKGIALYDRLVIERPESFWLHFRRGHALMTLGRTSEAEAAFREVLRRERGLCQAHSNLAVALCRQGRWQEAVAECQLAIGLIPEYYPAHSNLGWALNGLGQHSDAEKACREALRLNPYSPDALTNLGWALHGQMRYEEAVALYRESLRLKSSIPDTHNNLGNTLNELGRYKEAEAACREAIRLRPGYLEAYFNLGNALDYQGRYPEAVAAYQTVLRFKPDDPEAHFSLALAHAGQRLYKQAEQAYREALRLRPNYADALHGLGVVLVNLERFPEAERAFREALRLTPGVANIHVCLGDLYRDQGDYRKAEAEYRAALRRNPDPLVLTNLGSVLDELACYPEAEAALREAIRLKPDLAGAHSNLGIVLSKRERPKEAADAFREALRWAPEDPLMLANLACALQNLGEFREAEQVCRKAIRLKPDFPAAHSNLGNALTQQGRYPEAEVAYREALRLTPDHVEALISLGGCLEAQGRFAESLEQFRRGHLLGSKIPGWPHPSAEWVRKAELHLALNRRLPALLQGEAEPVHASERLQFAEHCQHLALRLYATAVRLAAEAFVSEPQLAADVFQKHRYKAACSAARTAAGQAEDLKNPPEKRQISLRRQALSWLRDDLATYRSLAAREGPTAPTLVRDALIAWHKEEALASVRDSAALARLPEDERQGWRQLWEDLAQLQKQLNSDK